MHQFQIVRLVPIEVGGYDISFTNSSLWMVLAVVGVTLFMTIGMRRASMVPGRWQSTVEMAYEFIANMVRTSVGDAGQRFFPVIFTLFMFILFANLFGMIPGSFTVTSHIIVTFFMAAIVFLTVVVLGFAKNGIGFLKFFVPSGLPAFLLPLIVLIEVISFLSRPISLSVRLFANMMAGHTMLKVFAGFVIMMGSAGAVGMFGAIIPIAVGVAVTGLEFLVAFLQAFIFAVLTCIYLNDALNFHPH